MRLVAQANLHQNSTSALLLKRGGSAMLCRIRATEGRKSGGANEKRIKQIDRYRRPRFRR
jgi:hypothetical protein